MQIDSMTFTDFLMAKVDANLVAYLESIEPIPDAFFNPLFGKLKMYFVTGGMPEPVKMWTEVWNVPAMQKDLSGSSVPMSRTLPSIPILMSFRTSP